MKAVGNYTVLLVLFGMILFGAVDSVGDTLYITKWILTRKIFAGRPLVFMALFYLCCSVLAGLISPITGLIILWPISLRIAETMNLTREDAAWKYFFVGMFLTMTLAQPLLPFKGAALVPVAAFQTMTSTQMPILAHMLVDRWFPRTGGSRGRTRTCPPRRCCKGTFCRRIRGPSNP